MFVIGGFILGALIGASIAKKRGGKRADILHYGFVYALAFALAGVIVTFAVHRSLV